MSGWRPGDRRADTHSMLRVDQAGEYGATRIYAGQLAVLRRNCPEAKLIARMAAQEERHLERFNALMAERRVRPTALQPVWNVAGFALGAVDRAHVRESGARLHRRGRDRDRSPLRPAARSSLATRIPSLPPTLPNSAPTSSSIAIRRATAGATGAIGYPLLTAAIRAGCRVAIALSKRI